MNIVGSFFAHFNELCVRDMEWISVSYYEPSQTTNECMSFCYSFYDVWLICSGLYNSRSWIVNIYYIIAGRACEVAKEVFHHRNVNILTRWELSNNENKSFWLKFNYINILYSKFNFNRLKLKYTDPCNFLTKRALVSQLSTLVVAKDSNISHYLNLSSLSRKIIIRII